jgi:hypothetical protein
MGMVVTNFMPISVLAEETPAAPADIQAMIDAGQVKLAFYNPQTNPRRFLGETKYDYNFRHSFQADYEPVLVKGKTTSIKARLKNVTVTAKHTHTMHLPESRRGPGLWDDTLTLHEFDHVALSIDPRIKKLLEAVLLAVEEVRFPLPAGQEFSTDWLNIEIDKLLTARGQTVYALVTYNNRRLDQLTDHGTQPIPNRDAYFKRLYTKPNLDEAGFPLTGELLEFLKSESYQMLEPHHLP